MIMTKWIAQTFVALIFLMTVVFTSPSDASVLMIDSQKGKQGDTVIFTISVHHASNDVKAFGVDLAYDASVLGYQKFEPGSLVSGFTNFSVSNIAFGVVRIGGFDVGQHLIHQGTSGSLVRLNFKVAGQNSCSFQLINLTDDFSGWKIRNGSFTNESVSEESGSSDESASETSVSESKDETKQSYQITKPLESISRIIQNPSNHGGQFTDISDSSQVKTSTEYPTVQQKDSDKDTPEKKTSGRQSNDHVKPIAKYYPPTDQVKDKFISGNALSTSIHTENPENGKNLPSHNSHVNDLKTVQWYAILILIISCVILVIQIWVVLKLNKLKG